MRSYRDELEAAHARIAVLEEQLAATALRATSDARVAALQESRDKAARAASPRNAKRVGIVFGVVFGTLFTVPALLSGLYGLAVFGLVFGAAMGAFIRWASLRSGADILKKMQQELDDALRLRALENQVAETRTLIERAQENETTGMRVAASSGAASEEEEELQADDGQRSHGRR